MSPNLDRDLAEVIEQVGSAWSDLKGARILITGGTGFFGCWLLESLLHANRVLGLGARAVVLTRDPSTFRTKAPELAGNPAVELLQGDVLQFSGISGECSHLIHAAVEGTDPNLQTGALKTFDSIVLGTRNVLDWASTSSLDRALFTSSGAVYGPQPPGLERIPDGWTGAPECANPRAAYAEGKRAAETLCSLFSNQSGLSITIARCFAFTGPYLPLDLQFAVGNFIRDALRGGPIVLAGDGTPCRSYLYASDLAAWLWLILLRGEPGIPINVGSEEAISIAGLAELVSRLAGGVAVQIQGTPDPSRLPERYVPETTRAKAMGLQVNVEFEQAILRTVEWNRHIQAGC